MMTMSLVEQRVRSIVNSGVDPANTSLIRREYSSRFNAQAHAPTISNVSKKILVERANNPVPVSLSPAPMPPTTVPAAQGEFVSDALLDAIPVISAAIQEVGGPDKARLLVEALKKAGGPDNFLRAVDLLVAITPANMMRPQLIGDR